MGSLGPGLVGVWVELPVGMLLIGGLGVPVACPARDRPRTRACDVVSLRLDDRDLEDDPPSALARRTTAARGRPPATIEGHAAVMSPHRWPSRYLLRPQLLTRRSPLPMGRELLCIRPTMAQTPSTAIPTPRETAEACSSWCRLN